MYIQPIPKMEWLGKVLVKECADISEDFGLETYIARFHNILALWEHLTEVERNHLRAVENSISKQKKVKSRYGEMVSKQEAIFTDDCLDVALKLLLEIMNPLI